MSTKSVTLFLVVLYATAAAAVSKAEDAHCVRDVCQEKFSHILGQPDSNICSEEVSKKHVDALYTCTFTEDGPPCDIPIRSETKTFLEDFGARRTRSCDKPRALCDETTIALCILRLSEFALITSRFPLDDVGKFCDDLDDYARTILTCTSCIGLAFSSSYAGPVATLQTYLSIFYSFQKETCECVDKAMASIENIINLVVDVNNPTTPTVDDCRQVEIVALGSVDMLNHCVLDIVGIFFDFPSIVDNYITILRRFPEDACIWESLLSTGQKTSTNAILLTSSLGAAYLLRNPGICWP